MQLKKREREREREKQIDRQTDRQTDRHREKETASLVLPLKLGNAPYRSIADKSSHHEVHFKKECSKKIHKIKKKTYAPSLFFKQSFQPQA